MRTKKWTFYIVYSILVTVVFLYWRFPSETVKNYIVSTLMSNYPDIILSIGNANPGFPPAIKFENLVIRFKNRPASALEAGVVRARPCLKSFFSNRLSFIINANAYGGNIDGSVSFANRFPAEEPIQVKVELDDINMVECSFIRTVLGRQIEGNLEGTIAYNGRYRETVNGTGMAKFVLLNGSIQLLKSMFGFDKLIFDSIKADMILKNQTLKINEFNLVGKQIQGFLKGNIYISSDIAQSRLALKGNADVPALNRRFSIFLNGTLANPIPRFM